MKKINELSKELREKLQRIYQAGNTPEDCEACLQGVHLQGNVIYKNDAMALELLGYELKTPRFPEFHHSLYPNFVRMSFFLKQATADTNYLCSSFPKLRHYGMMVQLKELISVNPDDVDSKKLPTATGYWTITSRGREFLLGHLKVPRICYTYNSRVIGFSEDKEKTPHVNFQMCLESKRKEAQEERELRDKYSQRYADFDLGDDEEDEDDHSYAN